jgi:ubiquinone/menaquinone biosynthesis C-methylase UbiE
MTVDPQTLAAAHFTQPDIFVDALSLVERYATDPPLVIEGLLRALAPERAGARILETGFGTAWLLELMTERFPDAELTGIDLSPSFVAAARQKLPGATILEADMEDIPFPDGTFDRVASCCNLYFARDIEKAIAELARVTRKGGRVVINTVGSDNLKELDAFTRRLLSETPLEDTAARFDLESGRPLVEKLFPQARTEIWPGTMTLPDCETFVRYWASFHHREVTEAGVLDRAMAAAKDMADAQGRITITRRSGAFLIDL